MGAPCHYLKLMTEIGFDAKIEAKDRLGGDYVKELKFSVYVVTSDAVHQIQVV